MSIAAPQSLVSARTILKAAGFDVDDRAAWQDTEVALVLPAYKKEMASFLALAADAYSSDAASKAVGYQQRHHWALVSALALLQAQLASHRASIRELRDQLETQQAGTTMRYRGVWKPMSQAKVGEFYTHDGSLWHANVATSARPGEDHAAWTLACKRGRDGKDARP